MLGEVTRQIVSSEVALNDVFDRVEWVVRAFVQVAAHVLLDVRRQVVTFVRWICASLTNELHI